MSINMFADPVINYCRNAVKFSQSNCNIEKEQLIGIEYEKDGRYHKIYLDKELDSLVAFICSSAKNKLITDGMDYAILNTIGKYIDLCIDTVPLDKLIKALEPYKGDYD